MSRMEAAPPPPKFYEQFYDRADIFGGDYEGDGVMQPGCGRNAGRGGR